MKTKGRRKAKAPLSTGHAARNVLMFKVVELSTVDETTIEQCLNEWSLKGWRFDGIQFAMRESSRRPSMAFVLFNRETKASQVDVRESSTDSSEYVPNPEAARARLARLAKDDDFRGDL